MRTPYLVFVSLALVGCSNAPSTSDVERVLETTAGSCQNVSIADVEKTNGYEDDGYYRVEYTYKLQLKNESGLKELKQTWLDEIDREAEYKPAREAYEHQVREVEDGIAQIELAFKEKSPSAEQFSSSGRPFWALRGNEREAYDAAHMQWQNDRYAATAEKRKELDALKIAWNESRAKVLPPTVLGKEGNVMHAFYSRGCSRAGWNYAKGMFDAVSQAVGEANAHVPPGVLRDASHWFEEQEAHMTGTIAMRKTENGWRALNSD